MTKLVLPLALMIAGCVLDGEGDEPELASTEQADNNTGVSNTCYYSGGTQWCQDYYSHGWCTGSMTHTANGWDYTGCTWRGWNASGTVFCGTDEPGYPAGWQWGLGHTHCP